jgi:hypothetical protein
MVTKHKFKVGDWVVIDNLDRNMSGKIGHIFQISKIEKNNNWYYATKKTWCSGSCWKKENLRLATNEEIIKAGGIPKKEEVEIILW